MAQYINKYVVIAEIEKRFDEYSSSILKHYDACTEARASELGKILIIVNSLEVKEVDVEKEKPKKPEEDENYIDLELPSGTLWKLFNEDGYYRFNEAVEKFGDFLPTKEQWEELKDECKWVWKDNGYDVIGPNGNKIFLRAAGFRDGTRVYSAGTNGYYWSSKYDNNNNAWCLYFYDEFHSMRCDDCYYYHSVRLVK